MNLPEKVASLEFQGYVALRVAAAYKGLAARIGWKGAEQFYTERGLNHIDPIALSRNQPTPQQIAIELHVDKNHLEKKSFDWEGLTLSREPKEHEKLAVKGIHQAQQSAKESISTILLNLRQELIQDGLEGISKLDPAKYHTLVLQAPSEFRKSLRDRLVSTYRQGRRLVAVELGGAKESAALFGSEPGKAEIKGCAVAGNAFKQDEEDEFDELDDLVGVTDARISNDVQSRITAAATRFALLGLVGSALLNSVRSEVEAGSVSYIDRASTGVANRVINIGRGDEMRDREDDIERYSYSALLDQNTCPSCLDDDGKEAASPDDLPATPNPDCDGADYCRCFIVAIVV